MKTQKINIVSILLGIFIGIVLIACISATQSSPQSSENQEGENLSENNNLPIDYQSIINENYKIYSLPMPENANFAGEIVPLENIIVKESLDKELLSNTYWHSNTFFFIKRAYRWFPLIEKILKENDVPDDFKYLAVIESGLLNVTSPSGAKGYWQFMPQTAPGYGLEISSDVDERYHVEKATVAACKYLKEAYKKFDNWTLAAASYNMGKTGLMNRLQAQKVNNYYDLLLNPETARYVYRIVAVKYILSQPENYGFHVRDEDKYPPFETKEVKVDSSIKSLVDFAIAQGTNYKTLKELNPWLISNSLANPKTKTYTILLPKTNSGLDNVAPADNKFGSND